MKNKKSIIAIGIIISILFSTVSVFGEVIVEENISGQETFLEDEANVKISREEAIKIAKDVLESHFNFKIDETFRDRISLENDYSSNLYIWQITWNKQDDNKSYYISVHINGDTGEVIRFNKDIFDNESKASIPTILKEDARKISNEFLKSFKPDISNNVVLEERNYISTYPTGDYRFDYIRVNNGIKYGSNSVSIRINGNTGEITSYYEKWDYNDEFESSDNIKNKEFIKNSFYNNITMKLLYIPVEEDIYGDIDDVILTYVPSYAKEEDRIYAKSGEFVSNDVYGEVIELTEEEQKSLVTNVDKRENTTKILTMDEAKVIIKKYVSELCSEATISSIRYEKNNEPYYSCDEMYTVDLRIEKGNSTRGFSFKVDAYTGDIIEYYNFKIDGLSDTDTSNNKTWEECYNLAVKAAAKYYPKEFLHVNTKQRGYKNNELSTEYSFYFSRKVNGIDYSRDSLRITVNVDGKIVGLSKSWNNKIEFPETNNIIDSQSAKDLYFEIYDPILIYYKKRNMEGKEDGNVANLVYILQVKEDFKQYTGYSLIDAKSGKFVDYNGRMIEEEETSKKPNIVGHWAEKPLTIFESQTYINLSEIEVDSNISLGELIKLIVKVRGYHPYYQEEGVKLKFTNIDEDDDIYSYLQGAVNYKLIDNEAIELELERTITREELAKFLVKIKDLDKIAKLQKIYNMNKIYLDSNEIDEEYIGYVALCYGLDIMVGNNGKFNPKEEVTYAQAVVSIYNALVK